MSNTRKVLYSPGFGAGWSTWAHKHSKELATDHKLVELAEQGKVLLSEHSRMISEEHVHPEFLLRVKEICGDDTPYLGGLRDLRVTEVSGPFQIEEYDGSESIRCKDQEDWW